MLAQTDVSSGVTVRASYDGNGNIVAWTNTNGNAPTYICEYDAFGNTLVSEGRNPSPFGFSTKMRDEQTDLYYYGFRYYDPVTGRWLSRDPIAERGGINLYEFSDNAGMDYVDCFGLDPNNPLATDISGNISWKQDGKKTRNGKISYTLKHYSDCRLVVEVHVRFVMPNKMKKVWDKTDNNGISQGQMVVNQINQGIANRWNNKYKLCCENCITRCKQGIKIEAVLAEDNTGNNIQIFNDPNAHASFEDQWNLAQGQGIGDAAAHEFGHFLGNPEGYGLVSDINTDVFNRLPGLQNGIPRPQEGVDTEKNGIMGLHGGDAQYNDFWNILANAWRVKLTGCSLKKIDATCK